jgi:hypothetical protein
MATKEHKEHKEIAGVLQEIILLRPLRSIAAEK